MRIILPVAVTLKRFAAPRWVLSFNFGFDLFLGIAKNLSRFVLGGVTVFATADCHTTLIWYRWIKTAPASEGGLYKSHSTALAELLAA
jgi:hypothetical protein